MKIMMTTPYYSPKIGGLENYARQLAIALRAQGDEIVVVTSKHDPKQPSVETLDGMTVYRLGRLFKLFNTPVNPFWPLSLRKIIRSERPAVIMTHSPVPTMADATMLAADKTPVILFYHAATLLKKDAPVFNAIAQLYRLYESLTFTRAKTIGGVSSYVVSNLPKRFQTKAVVVPNAVWSAELSTVGEIVLSTEFVFIASLDKTHSWKGLAKIIEAFSIYKKQYGDVPHLNVIGDGNHRTHYEAMVRELGLDNAVRFYGALDGSEKQAIVARARALLCYPTTSNDAFPTVMLEAWALGVVVMAAAIGPLPSLVNDSVDGVLVTANDAASLALALHDMVKRSPAQIRAIAEAALRRVKKEYTWEIQAKLVHHLAEGML
jgi:glycosyltransferase involved in cell wall biosynthesis